MKQKTNQTQKPNHWNSESVEKLKEMAGKASVSDIAVAVGHSVNSTRSMASELKISLSFSNVRWTTEQKERLRQMAGRVDPKSIAKEIGRSERSVRDMAKQLHLSVAIKEPQKNSGEPSPQEPEQRNEETHEEKQSKPTTTVVTLEERVIRSKLSAADLFQALKKTLADFASVADPRKLSVTLGIPYGVVIAVLNDVREQTPREGGKSNA